MVRILPTTWPWPKTDSSRVPKASSKRTHNKNGSPKPNGIKTEIANLYGDGVLDKEYEDGNGNYLTSTKPPKGSLKTSVQDGMGTKARKTDELKSSTDAQPELVTGREAGAGWHQSP